jgi:hypothetical protein
MDNEKKAKSEEMQRMAQLNQELVERKQLEF